MRQLTINTALALGALVVSPLGLAAPFAGGESSNTHIEVGESTVSAGPHSSGLAGIGIYTTGLADKVDLQFLAAFVGLDANGVHVLDMPIDVDDPDHSGMGVFSFVQVGSGDVWFGEWSQDGANDFTDRAVFYIGDKDNASMPESGTAVYSVGGLNQYAGGQADLMNGSVTVNFGGGAVSGSLENSDLGINVTASISGSSFSGTAEAYNPNTSATLDGNGISQGEFYGVDAAVLAGMATFANNPDYDTSFGGARGAITNP